MASIYPFSAVMPAAATAAAVSSEPYDVVSRDDVRRTFEQNPLTFLQVTRADALLPPDIDPSGTEVYQRAYKNYHKLAAAAPLQPVKNASLFLYALTAGDCTQTGLAGAMSIDEYDCNVIRKHERTRKQKEDDRTRHILTVRAQTGPVFLAYRDSTAVDEAVEHVMQTVSPTFDFSGLDGVRHQVWQVPTAQTRAIQQGFASLQNLYIADGHHRAAAASRARAKRRAENSAHTGTEAYNRFLTVSFPASQLKILAYNRVANDLAGLSRDSFLKRLNDTFSVERTSSPIPAQRGVFCVYLGGGDWRRIEFTGSRAGRSRADRLDVSILQDFLLEPVLKIQDPRTDERIDFVGGSHGTKELERRVDSGKAAVAFSLYPPSIEQLFAIADAGGIMPPKSTWFEPKLRDGLFIHEI